MVESTMLCHCVCSLLWQVDVEKEMGAVALTLVLLKLPSSLQGSVCVFRQMIENYGGCHGEWHVGIVIDI